jgi:hypothetical protein
MLLKTALKNSEWNFIKEIVRFLSAIGKLNFKYIRLS